MSDTTLDELFLDDICEDCGEDHDDCECELNGTDDEDGGEA